MGIHEGSTPGIIEIAKPWVQPCSTNHIKETFRSSEALVILPHISTGAKVNLFHGSIQNFISLSYTVELEIMLEEEKPILFSLDHICIYKEATNTHSKES